MIHRVQFEEWFPFPLDVVFLFFANPENLPRIMPPASDTRINRLSLVSPSAPTGIIPTTKPPLAGVGSEIVTSVRLIPFLPFRASWIARVTEFEWNHHFADIQEKGPFKTWHHRHEFATETRNSLAGTRVGDRIEYEVGFGVLGAMAHELFVSRQITRTFLHRQRVLAGLLLETENGSPPE
jgi:ligand-binding SRPBCC domain-containing protein